MGQVIIRNLDDAVILRHKREAKRKGVSLEQHLRDVLKTHADVQATNWRESVEALREDVEIKRTRPTVAQLMAMDDLDKEVRTFRILGWAD